MAEGIAFGDIEADPEKFTTLLARVVASVDDALSGYVFAVLGVYHTRGVRIPAEPTQ